MIPDQEQDQEPHGWTEARVARAIAMAVSGVVVVADLWLLVVFLRAARGLPGGLSAYWYILAGIAAVLAFALRRLRRHWGAFRAGE